MVTQESAPSRGRRSASLDHILRDTGLSDLEAELEQLTMDARRSPQRLSPLTNDPECRGMLLSEAPEWLQEARHRGSTLPLLADLILDVTSGEAEKLSSR